MVRAAHARRTARRAGARLTPPGSVPAVHGFADPAGARATGRRGLRRVALGMVALLLLAWLGLPSAGSPQPGEQPGGLSPGCRAGEVGWLGDPELERLLAPIALFDDRLLLDTLQASACPVQVLQLRRRLRDPAPRSLILGDLPPGLRELSGMPRVLDMLGEHPAWTRRLCEAFGAQEADVLRAVQRLRWRAVHAGSLISSEERALRVLDGMISIEPVGRMVLPVYDPWCVYGPWAVVRRDAIAYEPPPSSCEPAARRQLTRGGTAASGADFPAWGGIDWDEYDIWVDPHVWWSLAAVPPPATWHWRGDEPHPWRAREMMPRQDLPGWPAPGGPGAFVHPPRLPDPVPPRQEGGGQAQPAPCRPASSLAPSAAAVQSRSPRECATADSRRPCISCARGIGTATWRAAESTRSASLSPSDNLKRAGW